MKKISALITPKNALIAAAIFFAFLFITQGDPFIHSDGYGCYHTAKTIVTQGNFVTTDKPEYYDYMEHTKAFYNGNYVSVCPPGSAIMNIPLLFIANIFDYRLSTANNYFMAYNGNSIWDGLAVLTTASVLGFLTLILIYKTLRNLEFGEKTSIFSTAAVYLSSYALWYVFLLPSFTHTYELFGISLALYGLTKYLRRDKDKLLEKSLIKYIDLCGIGTGIAVISRPVIIIFPIMIICFLLFMKKFKDLGYFVLGNLPFALIYISYNLISFGKIFTTGYSDVRGENFDFSTFNGLNLLFSQYRGWFVYSPVMLIGVIGLILMLRKLKLRFIAIISLISIVFFTIVYGFWIEWWAGGSFGNRFMIILIPFAAIGLAFLISNFSKYKKIIILISVICCLYSMSLLFLYRITPVANLRPKNDNDGVMTYADRYTPIDIFKYQIDLIRNSTSIKNYFGNLYKSINGGSGNLIILLGINNTVMRVFEEGNTINLIYLRPPILKRQAPAETSGIIEYKGQFYFFDLSNISPVQQFSFACLDTCKSDQSNFQIQKTSGKQLAVTDYTGMNYGDVNIYFSRTLNMQFRGQMIDLKVGQEFY